MIKRQPNNGSLIYSDSYYDNFVGIKTQTAYGGIGMRDNILKVNTDPMYPNERYMYPTKWAGFADSHLLVKRPNRV